MIGVRFFRSKRPCGFCARILHVVAIEFTGISQVIDVCDVCRDDLEIEIRSVDETKLPSEDGL